MSERARYWRRVITAWEESGLSQAEFCRCQGISAAAFGWWKRRLGVVARPSGRQAVGQAGQPKNRRRAAFVEVGWSQPTTDVNSTTAVGLFSSALYGYEIALRNGRLIRLGRDFDAQLVAQLVAAVESC